MRKALRDTGARLGAVEQELTACSALATAHLSSLQQKLDGRGGALSRELAAVQAQIAEARGTIVREARPAGPAADPVVAEALAALAPLEGAVTRSDGEVNDARSQLDRLLDESRRLASTATAPLVALAAQLATGRQTLAGLDRKLGQMEDELEATLAALEKEVKGSIDTVCQALQQAV